jgi:hypothetical protein
MPIRSNAAAKTSRGWAPNTSRRLPSTHRDRLRGGRGHAFEKPVAVEHLVDLGPVQAGLRREAPQRVQVTDVHALGPVGVHQPVVHAVVQAPVARQLGQPQRGSRVRHDLGRRRVHEADRGKHLADPVVKRLAVPGVQLLARNPLRRVLGMEVERKPRDLGAVPAPEPVGRGLADPAERSDVVRPDQNGGLGHGDDVTLTTWMARAVS